LTPTLAAQLERLASAGIRLLSVPEIPTHFVFEREDCVVLVERRGEGFGAIGSPGLLSDNGFAALVTRDSKDWFVGKVQSRPAAGGEASAARRLYRDLRDILG